MGREYDEDARAYVGEDGEPTKQELTPDHELLDERLEEGEQYTIRAHCVGHPFGRGGGCGWAGTAKRESNVMPSCPECGGWAEPDAPKGGLRAVS